MFKAYRRILATALLALALAFSGCSSESKTRREPTPGAEKYLEDAREKLDSKHYTEAGALLDLARDEGAPVEPTNRLTAELERALGMKANQAGEIQQAYEHFVRAAELEPDPDQRFEDLVVAIEYGKQVGAMASKLAPLASQAVELKTSSKKAQRLAAQLWDDAGNAARALPYYQWLYKTSPDDSAIALRLGTLYLAEERVQEAKRVFRALHKAQPDNVIAALKLATVHAKLGEHAEAKALYEALLEKHPERTGVLMSYARYLDERGETERAEELRERAKQALPGIKRREMRKLR